MSKVPKAIRPFQNIILSMMVLLFCIVGIIFAVVPAAGKIRDMNASAALLREETETLSKKLAVLSNYDEQTLRDQLVTVLTAVPADRSFPTLFETVEGVAAQTGVSIKSMSIAGGTSLATPSAGKASAADKKLGTRTLSFAVNIEGALPNLEQFITTVPKVRRLMRMKVFSIGFPKDDRPVNINIDMDGFYEPLPTSLGTTKATIPTLTDSDISVIDKLGQFPLVTQASAELPAPAYGKVKDNPFMP